MVTLLTGTVIDESHDAVHFFTPAECQTFYGRPRVVKYITIHHWGNRGQDFDTVRDFLCSYRPNNPTSAHAVIMEGRAASIISPDNAAFHAGNAVGNAESIGLECRPEATDGDYREVAAYIAYLRSIYGNVPLRKHSDWYATACPGVWDLGRLDRMANDMAANGIQIVVPESTPAPAPAKEEEVGQMLIIGGDPNDGTGKIWIGDGVTRRHIPDPGVLDAYRKLNEWGMLKIYNNGQYAPLPPDVLGVDVVGILAAQINTVLEAVKAIPGVKPEDIAGLKEALKAQLDAATSDLSVTLTKKPE